MAGHSSVCLIRHRRFIVPEEHKLEATFGARFLEYKGNVRRWI